MLLDRVVSYRSIHEIRKLSLWLWLKEQILVQGKKVISIVRCCVNVIHKTSVNHEFQVKMISTYESLISNFFKLCALVILYYIEKKKDVELGWNRFDLNTILAPALICQFRN